MKLFCVSRCLCGNFVKVNDQHLSGFSPHGYLNTDMLVKKTSKSVYTNQKIDDPARFEYPQHHHVSSTYHSFMYSPVVVKQLFVVFALTSINPVKLTFDRPRSLLIFSKEEKSVRFTNLAHDNRSEINLNVCLVQDTWVANIPHLR